MAVYRQKFKTTQFDDAKSYVQKRMKICFKTLCILYLSGI